MKRLTIDIFEKGDKELIGMIDMNSEELGFNYCDTPTMQGLQCNFDGDTKEYNAVLEKVQQISDLVRELNKIYK
ncbi:hypothetical protein BJV85_002075 [Clostridium acetobutylicum]|uniref:Uncharacterized protein n=1 Tax=Clostridium acetobutylicum (strain ATCC 824 / DSM 792 / JCM 1419 / IAM 19013 / LMG 5710 / NBRC 13948 / NRRL B-527 / VKM B-1787 / 2291 / W) TaxID=272562 RepID=Q97HT9_CLOAB|nr:MULTISPECIES: hypothetical protein [Clostridium]AAK79881.1 Hypothetical protein CA_C1918 [Clostridium acetobutylicum ATCC 824]ADZ20970.1 Conserved hypothetical protein [Clostridium acetobutylicum EA 2018]AEI32058.1 hypothetical protein SMB_G1946 [Clostridium acetobutylicum DSM 1731]AWV79688.1 hypothetical protein DK921_06155 [Clostridium acetobutylicum]MBC2394336.1 hypothetical protein [Clostridium acetobutylicum]